MNTAKTAIKSASRLSNATYHKRCHTNGQRFWWLRDQAGNFIRVPGARGDSYFEAELDLKPGTYTLGCGPQGSHGIRETITVPA